MNKWPGTKVPGLLNIRVFRMFILLNKLQALLNGPGKSAAVLWIIVSPNVQKQKNHVLHVILISDGAPAKNRTWI